MPVTLPLIQQDIQRTIDDILASGYVTAEQFEKLKRYIADLSQSTNPQLRNFARNVVATLSAIIPEVPAEAAGLGEARLGPGVPTLRHGLGEIGGAVQYGASTTGVVDEDVLNAARQFVADLQRRGSVTAPARLAAAGTLGQVQETVPSANLTEDIAGLLGGALNVPPGAMQPIGVASQFLPSLVQLFATQTGAVPGPIVSQLEQLIGQPLPGQATLRTREAFDTLMNLYRQTFGAEPPRVNPGLFG